MERGANYAHPSDKVFMSQSKAREERVVNRGEAKEIIIIKSNN